MYLEGGLKQYLDDLASSKPAPGGGSAAAAAGALGVAALSMVANFTIGKEKYKAVEAEMKTLLATAEGCRMKLQRLIDADVVAYGMVSAAYKLPKETDDQKKIRTKAIQAALREAMQVPLETCRILADAMALCAPLVEKGNTNLASDVAVGAQLIAAAYDAAFVNVEMNLSGLDDAELKVRLRDELVSKSVKIVQAGKAIGERVRKGMK